MNPITKNRNIPSRACCSLTDPGPWRQTCSLSVASPHIIGHSLYAIVNTSFSGYSGLFNYYKVCTIDGHKYGPPTGSAVDKVELKYLK
jgi:hypothetical protein